MPLVYLYDRAQGTLAFLHSEDLARVSRWTNLFRWLLVELITLVEVLSGAHVEGGVNVLTVTSLNGVKVRCT